MEHIPRLVLVSISNNLLYLVRKYVTFYTVTLLVLNCKKYSNTKLNISSSPTGVDLMDKVFNQLDKSPATLDGWCSGSPSCGWACRRWIHGGRHWAVGPSLLSGARRPQVPASQYQVVSCCQVEWEHWVCG